MVFITSGMNVRIPAGGLTLSMTGDKLESSLRLEVALDTWYHWLEIGLKEAIEAKRYHNELLREIQGEDRGDKKGELLEAEFRASLISISSQVFALDSLYGSIKERVPAGTLKGVIGKSTARHQA